MTSTLSKLGTQRKLRVESVLDAAQSSKLGPWVLQNREPWEFVLH